MVPRPPKSIKKQFLARLMERALAEKCVVAAALAALRIKKQYLACCRRWFRAVGHLLGHPRLGLTPASCSSPPPPPPALSWHSAVYHTTCPIQPAPTCMRLYFPCSRCRQRAERQETEKEREREPRDRSRCVASSALLRSMRQACIRCIRGTCLGAFCAACRCAAATAAEMGQFLGCACHAVPPCATSHPAYLTAGSARRLNAQRTAAGA